MNIIISYLKKALMDGYSTSDINIYTILVCLGLTFVISLFIFLVYILVNKNSFYNKSFNISLIAMAMITSAIILTIQSNIVVSLGMVGALSIVRFRTAIKDPLDLIFLFWSISVGIICGAGFTLIAIIVSLALCLIVIVLSMTGNTKGNLILVINANSYKLEEEITKLLKNKIKRFKVRSRGVTKNSLSLAIEIKASSYSTELTDALIGIDGVSNVSFVEHDGNITA